MAKMVRDKASETAKEARNALAKFEYTRPLNDTGINQWTDNVDADELKALWDTLRPWPLVHRHDSFYMRAACHRPRPRRRHPRAAACRR